MTAHRIATPADGCLPLAPMERLVYSITCALTPCSRCGGVMSEGADVVLRELGEMAWVLCLACGRGLLTAAHDERRGLVTVEEASVHACVTCGTLWRHWTDGTYSLAVHGTKAGACCDNVPMRLGPPITG